MTPEDQAVLLIFDVTWLQRFTPQVGLRFSVLSAHLRGVYDGISVFYVGEEGHSYLARVWVDEDSRCLELFAGIGGWSATLPFLDGNCGCVSVENDPDRALLLAIRCAIVRSFRLIMRGLMISCMIWSFCAMSETGDGSSLPWLGLSHTDAVSSLHSLFGWR